MIDDIIGRAEKSGLSGGQQSPPSYSQQPPQQHQQQYMPQQQNVYAPSGPVTVYEMMIPGTKAGLVIGKNGETIKQLQEENGVKMVLIQATNAPTQEDKPLRITGDPARIEKVKQLVLEIISVGFLFWLVTHPVAWTRWKFVRKCGDYALCSSRRKSWSSYRKGR